jgi:predicted Zn-dependent peptidase
MSNHALLIIKRTKLFVDKYFANEGPTLHETTLENGLKILTFRMPQTRAVSVSFFVGTGSRYESDDVAGASHFIEHMLFKGTARRPTARHISEAIEGIGGYSNAYTGQDTTTYWAKVAAPHFAEAADVLIDMLRFSTFDPAEVEKERRIIVEEINMSMDAPDQWVGILLGQVVWPDHPLGRDVAGTRETVSGITRDQLLGYMERHYSPERIVVSVAGNVDHQQVIETTTERLQDWPSTSTNGYLPAPDGLPSPRWLVEDRPTELGHLCLAAPGLSRSHPDRFALGLLNTVLGEGMSSRLFLEVREAQGLAYAVDSSLNMLDEAGLLVIYAGVEAERTPQAIRAVLAELDRLRQEPVPEAELHKAREYVKGRLVLGMEDSGAVAAWYGQQALLLDEILSLDDVLTAYDAVTDEDIQRVAQTLFTDDQLQLAAVGPFGDGNELGALLSLD